MGDCYTMRKMQHCNTLSWGWLDFPLSEVCATFRYVPSAETDCTLPLMIGNTNKKKSFWHERKGFTWQNCCKTVFDKVFLFLCVCAICVLHKHVRIWMEASMSAVGLWVITVWLALPLQNPGAIKHGCLLQSTDSSIHLSTGTRQYLNPLIFNWDSACEWQG